MIKLRGTIVCFCLALMMVGCGDDDDAGGQTEWPCAESSCVNADGNTHTDCDGPCDFCTPNIDGVENIGIPALTCTKADCVTNDDCPKGLSCFVMPQAAIDRGLNEFNVILPESICGK